MRKSPSKRGIPLSTLGFRSHGSRPSEDELRNLIPYDWFYVKIARSDHVMSILADGPWLSTYSVPRVDYWHRRRTWRPNWSCGAVDGFSVHVC